MKVFVRILMLLVLTLTVLASTSDNKLGRRANCRNMTSNNGQCPRTPYTVYYTDATKTVECGYLDACEAVFEGCHTEFYTRYYHTCCNPPINP